MKRKKSIFLVLMIFTLFFVYMSSTSTANIKQVRPTIKIGGLGPLAITPGNDMKNALEMAVAEINDGDGVMVGSTAYDFDLVIKTSSGDLGIPDPTVGVTFAVELIDAENVTAIIGGFRTEVVMGIQMSTGLLDRPFLGIGASAPIVSPHFWRIGPGNVSGLARNIIDMYAMGLIPDEGVRNITIIRESAAWTLAMALSIKDTITTLATAGVYGPGVTISFSDDIIIPVTDQLDDVSSAMSGLTADVYQGLELNALCTIFSGPVGAYIPQVWAALDLPMFLAGINVESQVSTFFDETEGACYGEIELETCPPDVNPTQYTAAFRTAYDALYSELPTYTSFASYDAVYVLKEAIEAADSLAYEDIEAALANVEYEGTAYTLKFTSEPGPHWTVAENETTGLPYYVPILTNSTYPEGIPIGAFEVHDLYTNGSVGVDGRPYTIGYWVQWQQGGVKKTVWHLNHAKGYNDLYSPMDNQRNLTEGNLVWPINHADHGWVEETTTTTEDGTDTGTATTTGPTTTTEESVEIPGFDLQISLLVLCAVSLIFYRQRQKKR